MWPPGSGGGGTSADTVCPCPSVTLTFDRLTLKLVCESQLRWGIVTPNVGTLGRLWVLEVFAMYVTDGQTQTDGRTDKRNAYCPLLYGGNLVVVVSGMQLDQTKL